MDAPIPASLWILVAVGWTIAFFMSKFDSFFWRLFLIIHNYISVAVAIYIWKQKRQWYRVGNHVFTQNTESKFNQSFHR